MNRYQVFVKVVEIGSFTRTAEALGYTQSAVSQNVAALENELSATLLHRTKSGVGLTADGREYFHIFRPFAPLTSGWRKSTGRWRGWKMG